jgi:hypothetical protein
VGIHVVCFTLSAALLSGAMCSSAYTAAAPVLPFFNSWPRRFQDAQYFVASFNTCFISFYATLFHDSVMQAIFKEARETLLRIGTMRFVDSLVTERPMPPARTLHASNETHSLAFRFGTEDSVSSSPEDRASCIVPMLSLHVDSRALDGQLSVFQSTPAGTCVLRFCCIIPLTA